MYHGLLEMSRLIECYCLWSRWSITGMYHGLLEMARLIECVTAFGPDGALQVCIMVC